MAPYGPRQRQNGVRARKSRLRRARTGTDNVNLTCVRADTESVRPVRSSSSKIPDKSTAYRMRALRTRFDGSDTELARPVRGSTVKFSTRTAPYGSRLY